MLEWVYITNRIKYDQLYNEVDLIDSDNNLCIAANELQLPNMFGKNYIEFKSLNKEMERDLVEQSLYRLVLHEVGHTLGLVIILKVVHCCLTKN